MALHCYEGGCEVPALLWEGTLKPAQSDCYTIIIPVCFGFVSHVLEGGDTNSLQGFV